jgi:hypothetical protein
MRIRIPVDRAPIALGPLTTNDEFDTHHDDGSYADGTYQMESPNFPRPIPNQENDQQADAPKP